MNTRDLKLTPFDDQIYTIFRQEFPTFNVDKVNEQDMKSAPAKIKWRAFIEKFKMIDCFDFGTLLRVDSRKEFGPDNSLLVIRVEFYAIEIARNREGCNDGLRLKYRPEKSKTADENLSWSHIQLMFSDLFFHL